MDTIDAETMERYEKIKRTLVCPECGQDVDKTTVRTIFEKLGGELEPDDDPEAVAYVCSHNDCKYAITVGEKAEAAA